MFKAFVDIPVCNAVGFIGENEIIAQFRVHETVDDDLEEP